MTDTKSTVHIVHGATVPMLKWRHYLLTAEQAQEWAVELLTAANEALKTFANEEAARDSRQERHP